MDAIEIDSFQSVPFIKKSGQLHAFFNTLIMVQVFNVMLILSLLISDVLDYKGFDEELTIFDFICIMSNIISSTLLIIYYLYVARPVEHEQPPDEKGITDESGPGFSDLTAGFIE